MRTWRRPHGSLRVAVTRRVSAVVVLCALLAACASPAQAGDAVPGPLVTITFRDTEIHAALTQLAAQAGVTIEVDPAVSGTVTASLTQIPVDRALDVILTPLGLQADKIDRTHYRVHPLSALPPAGSGGPAGPPGSTSPATGVSLPAETGQTRQLIVLKSADPDELVRFLAPNFPVVHLEASPALRAVLVIGPTAEVTAITTVIQQLDVPALPGSSSASRTEVIKLNSLDPAQAQQILSGQEPGTRVLANPQSGTVILMGPAQGVGNLKALTQSLDQEAPQILIEAKIVEISDSGLKNLGLQWDQAIKTQFGEANVSRTTSTSNNAINSTTQSSAPSTTNSTSTSATVGGVTTTVSSTQSQSAPATNTATTSANDATTTTLLGPIRLQPFGRSPINIGVILNALVNQGEARLIEQPWVIAREGKVSSLTTTQKLPYLVTQSSGSYVYSTVQFFDVGVKLEVMPRLRQDGQISLEIKSEVSQVAGVTPQGYPITSGRTLNSSVILPDGETIAIAGTTETMQTHDQSKVPVLGDLPVLGVLFQNNRVEKRNTTLLIFITPKIAKR